MRKLSLYSLISFLLLSPIAKAVEVERSDSNFNLEFIEGSRLDLSLTSEVFYIDNFLYSEKNKQSTSGYSINPKAFLQAHNEQHLVQFLANVDYIGYENFEDDSHTNSTLLAKYFFKLAPDHRLFVSTSFDDTFVHRGKGLTQGIAQAVDKGDEKQESLFNIGYQYGRVESVSQFNLSAGIENSEYQTRREVTEFYDFQRSFVQAELNYLIGTKTYFSSDVLYADYEYENAPYLDRNESLLLAGVKWDYSEASRFELLIGIQRIDFSNTDDSEDKFSWRASYHWQPNEVFSLKILSSRKTEDEAELDSYLKISDFYQLTVNYLMTDYLGFSLQVLGKDSELSIADALREDFEFSTLMGINYQYNDDIRANFSLSFNEKDSDINQFSYEQQLLSVGVDIRF